MMRSLCALVIAALLCAARVQSFAEWMTTDYCERSLSEGEVIMNARAEASSLKYIEVLRRNSENNYDIALNTVNDTFLPHETVMLRLNEHVGLGQGAASVLAFEAVFETSAGEFVKGGCKHKRRSAGSTVMLQLPGDAVKVVTLKAAWASGHQAVQLAPVLFLRSSSPSALGGVGVEGGGEGGLQFQESMTMKTDKSKKLRVRGEGVGLSEGEGLGLGGEKSSLGKGQGREAEVIKGGGTDGRYGATFLLVVVAAVVGVFYVYFLKISAPRKIKL